MTAAANLATSIGLGAWQRAGVVTPLIIEQGKLGAAYFSPCHRYRYLLTRGAPDAKRRVTFVMLNPSTADSDRNDPTVAKCIKFAAREATARGWEAHRVAIVNLYAIRATDPRDCFADQKPVGGAINDGAILETCANSEIVIAAWGSHQKASGRAREIRGMLDGIVLYRLGPSTKDGSPRHPLYLRDVTPLEEWV